MHKKTHPFRNGSQFRCGMANPHCFKQPLLIRQQLYLQQFFTELVASPGYLPVKYLMPVDSYRPRRMEPGGFEPPCCSSFFLRSTISFNYYLQFFQIATRILLDHFDLQVHHHLDHIPNLWFPKHSRTWFDPQHLQLHHY